MRKIILVLVLLFSNLFGGSLSFSDLTLLVSTNIKKNILLDKTITDFQVDMDIPKQIDPISLYEFYKVVLSEHDLELKHNPKGDFYYLVRLPKSPDLVHPDLKVNYYTYQIKNVTNKDVVKAMQVFGVPYQYLEQSDMIAYSATRVQNEQILDVLRSADNLVKQSKIKLSLFTSSQNNLLNYGSTINAFNFNLDSQFNDIIGSLKRGQNSSYILHDVSTFSFTLEAMQERSLVKIQQDPVIELTNGIETSVNSVLNVPYLKTTSSIDSTTNQTVEQYDYKDIGLQILVKPKIKDNWIYLDLNFISEELLSNDENKPITQKITYKSSLEIKKGKPVLLTGIKKVSSHIEKNGVPLLQNIPILGEIFKSSSDLGETQNINILLEVL